MRPGNQEQKDGDFEREQRGEIKGAGLERG